MPVLYNASQLQSVAVTMGGSLRGSGANGSQVTYVAIPPQDIRIGHVQLPKVPFFAPADNKYLADTPDFDGLLPVRLFERVFIGHAEGFAILEVR